MKIAHVADVHLGNHRQYGGTKQAGLNDRCRLGLAVFRAALDKAIEEGCEIFMALGDTLDVDNPSPQLMSAILDTLPEPETAVTGGGLFPIFLLGNHEQTSMMLGDHALGPFKDRAMIQEVPRIINRENRVDLVMVPFQPGPADEWLPEELHKLLGENAGMQRGTGESQRVRVLTLHLGIKDEDTPPFLQNAHDAISIEALGGLCEQYGITHVFTGNWHDHAVWDWGCQDNSVVEVTQLGTLCPTGWDNPGLDSYGKVAIFDTNTRETEIVEIPGPRFLKAVVLTGMKSPAYAKLEKQILGDEENSLYIRVTTLPEHVATLQAHYQKHQDEGNIIAFRVMPEDSDVKIALRTAAQVTQSADTLEQAVGAYVREMPLEESIDRGAVLARTKKYLGM